MISNGGVTEGCEVQAGAPSVDAVGCRVHPKTGSTLNYLAKMQAASPGALRLPCGGWQLPQAYRSAAEGRAVDDGAAVRGQRGLPVPSTMALVERALAGRRWQRPVPAWPRYRGAGRR